MNRIFLRRLPFIGAFIFTYQIAFASAPVMQSIEKVSSTQINVYFNESVQISGTYSSGFTLQDCKGFVFSVQSVADGNTGDSRLELTVSDLATAQGDLRLTYFNVDDPISDLQGNVFDTDGIGVLEYSEDHFEVDNLVYANKFITPAEDSSPVSFTFNNDGTKLFILGISGDASVYEYSLSTPYDISTSSYSGNSINIESQSSNPLHLAFNNDGSRLFVAAFVNRSFLEFSLTTNYDISTAAFVTSYNSPSAVPPTSFAFSNDGLRFFIMGEFDFIRQYDLSSPYNLASLPGTIQTGFDTNLNVAISFTFNHNGTRLYTIDRSFRAVNQFDLATPFDITTTGTGKNIDIRNTVGNDVGAILFRPDGSEFFAAGPLSNNSIYQFSVADVTGPVMTGIRKVDDNELIISYDEAVAATGSFPNNFTVLKNGSSVQVDGISDGTAGDNEISLLFSSPNDLAGATTIDVTYADATNNEEITDFVCNPKVDDLVGLSLNAESTPPTLTDATLSSSTEILLTFDEAVQITGLNASNFEVVGCRGTVFVATDISDPTILDSEIIITITELDFPDGSFTINYTDPGNGAVRDLSGNTLANFSQSITSGVTDVVAPTLEAFFKISATSLRLVYSEPVTAYEQNPGNFTLDDGSSSVQPTAITDGTPGDEVIFLDFASAISGNSLTLTYDNSTVNDEIADLACNPVATDPVGVTEIFETIPPEVDHIIKRDPTTLLVNFTEPIQLSAQFGVSNISVADCDGNVINVQSIVDAVPNDSQVEIVTDNFSSSLGDFTVTITSPGNEVLDLSANNLSNGSSSGVASSSFSRVNYDGNATVLSLTTPFSYPAAIAFDDTGLELFVPDLDLDEIRKFDLTVPFDISTATASTDIVDISADFDVPLGITFNPTGTIMYITGVPASGKVNYINQYNLTTPFDPTTATLNGGYDPDTNEGEDIPLGIDFNLDGSKMFLAGTRNDLIYEYNLSTNYDISTATYQGGGESFLITQTSDFTAFSFDQTGYAMFVLAQGLRKVFIYYLNAPFDVSTAVYDTQQSFLLSGVSTPRGLTFSNDGNKLFVVEQGNLRVNQYNLSDIEGPAFSSLEVISQNQVDVLYNEAVKIQGISPSDFILVDKSGLGDVISVTGIQDVTTGDERISLTVDLGAAIGDIEVTYSDANAEITDLSCNPASSATLGILDTDQDPPSMQSASQTGANEITLVFSEPVQTNGGNPGDFTVIDGLGSTYTVSAQQDGTALDNEIILTFSDLQGIVGDLTITYTNNNNEISDFGGNFFDTNTEGVGIDLDQTAPSITNVEVAGSNLIEVTYTEQIQLRTLNANFQVLDGALNVLTIADVVDGIAEDTKLTIEVTGLDEALGDVSVEYVTAGLVEDFGGNQANTSGAISIDVDQTAPTLVSVTKASDTELVLTFSEPVQTSGSNANDFEVIDNLSTSIQVISIADGTAQDDELVLTVGDLSVVDNDITITYIGGNNVVSDFGNNVLATDNVGINLDIVAPPPPQLVSIDSDNGESAVDFITNDNTLIYLGTAEANSTVEVFFQGTSQATTTANSSGDFTFDFSGTAAMDGVYESTFTATDESGNTSNASTVVSVTIDTNAPSVNSISRLDADGLNESVTSVSYEVTFDEDIYNLDVTDFVLTTNGTITANIGSITPINPSTYTVEIENISGTQGDSFGLNLEDDDSINDLAGNALGGVGASNGDFTGQLYSFKTPQTITFDQDLTGKTYGDQDFALTASASSNLPVSFSVTGPVSLSGNTITILGSGQATVTATQSGDVDFGEATPVTQTIDIAKAILSTTADDQSITFGGALPTFTISYTGFVGMDAVSDIDTAPTATSSATVTSDAGSYDIVLAGGSDDDYDFNYINGILTINKANQDLSFPAIAPIDLATTNTVTLSATSDAGLTVSYSLDQGDGSISGNTLTINATGSFTVTASQSGNVNYNAATDVSQSFIVNDSRKNDQTITFNAIPDNEYGEVVSLGASATSNLPVTYTLTSGVGTISNGDLTIEGVGSYAVTASQDGDNDFNPAQDVIQQFTVAKAPITVTADDQTINQGDPIPALTFSYSGFKLSDDESTLDSIPDISTTANSQSSAGTYPITLTGGADNLYSFTLVDGILTIEAVLGLGNQIIRVYPNPTSGILKIDGIQFDYLKVYDMEGRNVLESNAHTISVNDLSEGIYILRLYKNDKEIYFQRVAIN